MLRRSSTGNRLRPLIGPDLTRTRSLSATRCCSFTLTPGRARTRTCRTWTWTEHACEEPQNAARSLVHHIGTRTHRRCSSTNHVTSRVSRGAAPEPEARVAPGTKSAEGGVFIFSYMQIRSYFRHVPCRRGSNLCISDQTDRRTSSDPYLPLLGKASKQATNARQLYIHDRSIQSTR